MSLIVGIVCDNCGDISIGGLEYDMPVSQEVLLREARKVARRRGFNTVPFNSKKRDLCGVCMAERRQNLKEWKQ